MTLRSTTAIRAPIPAAQATLSFMIVDMAMADERGDGNNYACTARLFGVTAEGLSVCCRVRGFHPYVYVQCPATWSDNELDAKRREFIDHIAANCADRVPYFKSGLAESSVVCDRRNIFGYCGSETERLLRFAFHSQWALRRFCEFLSGTSRFVQEYDEENNCFEQRVERESDGERDARGFGRIGGQSQEFWLCDNCLTPLQQFINQSDVTPSGWVTVSDVREYAGDQTSRCQYDFLADLSCITPNDERDDIAPMFVESFDIECLRDADDGQMPDAQVAADSIIQIGSTVWRFGDADNAYVRQVVHCVGETTLTGVHDDGRLELRCYDDEAAMLKGYMRYMREEIDPDVRVAYNSQGFDHRYLQQRLERHFPAKGAVEREYGRMCGNVTEHCRSSYGGSRAHGGRTRFTVQAAGRVDFDLMLHARHAWKVFRGGLDALARDVLQRGKDAVAPAEIRAHWLSGDPVRRGVVARYCAVDTELALEVTLRRQVLLEALEMSRLCGIPLDRVFNKGVSQRACAMLAREAHRGGYVQPEQPQRYVRDQAMRACLFEGSVQGALVLEPTPGRYTAPICVVDFASLYPSIMRGYGLCWTTLILDRQKWIVERNTPHQTQRIVEPKSGAVCELHWATLPVNEAKPLLYRILTKLLDARKAAKQKMAQAKAANNAFLTSLYDAKQLAIKIVCNSMYGHCNCHFTPLFCPPIAAAVTDHGRRLLNLSKAFVENERNFKVIYGDTDSLLIDFGRGGEQSDFVAAFEQGRTLAREINERLPPEIRLEFEKVFYPFAMWRTKKKYCGVLYSTPDDKGTIVCKGMEKSDTMPLMQRVVASTVEHILTRADQATMVQGVKDLLAPLAVIPTSRAERQARDLALVDQLTIVKRLSKEPHMYAASSESDSKSSNGKKKCGGSLVPHVRVALDIAERCPGRAPCAGDPVEYVWALDNSNTAARTHVPVDVEQFKSQPERFQLHLPHYVSSLFHKRITALFDLPDGASGNKGNVEMISRLLDTVHARAEASLDGTQSLEHLFARQQIVHQQNDSSAASTTTATTPMATTAATTTATTTANAHKRDVASISKAASTCDMACDSSAAAGVGGKRQRTTSHGGSGDNVIAQMARTMQMFLSGRKKQ